VIGHSVKNPALRLYWLNSAKTFSCWFTVDMQRVFREGTENRLYMQEIKPLPAANVTQSFI
jgi:hypothetical protein